ncbi:hypothetical protein [Polynucleobacter ibericus]|uniref:hypothetical protein n=1 Tax=Polynucleobacter ibericus TaxID=1819725 RepID=UPI001BFEC04C|nr:hypothetical protein [Polynucleobacter ibericus]QWE09087.1 hypothetical protein AOC20_02400 [Polynucleobacter ibericus]
MKIFAYVLLSLVGLITLTATTDTQAYWHGYRGGWRGPGWGGGCWRCGPGWVGPAVVAGAEVVEGSTAPVVVEQAPPPVYVQQPTQVVAAPAQQVVSAPGPAAPAGTYSIPPVGSTFPNLLPGCFLAPRNGINFYQCQGFRMRPLYGGNAFYYRVVPG